MGGSLYNHAESWIAGCLEKRDIDLLEAVDVSGGSGCQVWECRTLVDGLVKRHVLKVYRPGFDDYSKLGPAGTACKYIYALEELPAYALCMPKVAGFACGPDQAAVLTERVLREPWDSSTRVKAAETLGRLHQIQLRNLSDEFGALVKGSTRNTQRIRIGVRNFASLLDQRAPTWKASRPKLYEQTQELLESQEPCSEMVTLVHGDYFSANLLFENGRLHVIDWDLLALGDPMWDLGFLIGADRNVAQKEVDAVIETYSQLCPIDATTLAWHKQCWYVFWELKHAVSVDPKTLSGHPWH